MLRSRQTGERVHREDEWLVHQDGSMVPIAWWSAPIDMPGGSGSVLAFTDISERLAAEEALRERDAAEIRAAESQAAQRRILDSAIAARRQQARDLHDGAQQRLVGWRSNCASLATRSVVPERIWRCSMRQLRTPTPRWTSYGNWPRAFTRQP